MSGDGTSLRPKQSEIHEITAQNEISQSTRKQSRVCDSAPNPVHSNGLLCK